MTEATEVKRIELYGFQEEFCTVGLKPHSEIDYLFLLAHGGKGSGKTRGGAMRALAYTMNYPGALGIITAPTHDMMHRATLATLLEVFNQAGLVMTIDYEYYSNRKEILFANGSKIYLGSTEEPQHLQGPTAAWFWMDEAAQSTRLAYLSLKERLRQYGFPHQGWITTTPQGRDHWLHDIFFSTNGESVDTKLSFRALTKDNPYGGAELYATLLEEYGENSPMCRQELLGEFVIVEGLTFPDWNPLYHIVPVSQWPVKRPTRVLAGVDFGFENPSAILVEGIDSEGRRYLMDEFYKRHQSEQDLIEAAKLLMEQYGISYFTCDVEDPRWIRAFRDAGLPAIRAKREIVHGRNPSAGIALCASALRKRLPSKEQAFFVAPSLHNFTREIESYTREEARMSRNPKEAPRPYGDHLMSAWRYAELQIKRIWDMPALPRRQPISLRIG